jgi:hypothetical protein
MRDLVGARVQGTSLIDHMPHSTHRQLAVEIFSQLRQHGGAVDLLYRLDEDRRCYTLQLSAESDQAGQLSVAVDSGSGESGGPESNRRQMVIMCSRCRQIKVDETWTDAIAATRSMNLLALDPVPPISHGLCSSCHA